MITRCSVYLVFFIFLLVGAGYCAAGEPERRTEIFGTLGFCKVWDDESDIGNGFNGGGGIEFRLHRHVGVLFEADYAGVSRTFPQSGVRFSGNNTILSGDAHFYFGSSRIQPYLLAGLGVAHLSETNTFSVEEGQQTFTTVSNTTVLQFGGGVRFMATPRISVRPELRFSALNQVRGTLSIGFSF